LHGHDGRAFAREAISMTSKDQSKETGPEPRVSSAEIREFFAELSRDELRDRLVYMVLRFPEVARDVSLANLVRGNVADGEDTSDVAETREQIVAFLSQVSNDRWERFRRELSERPLGAEFLRRNSSPADKVALSRAVEHLRRRGRLLVADDPKAPEAEGDDCE
jgi:hypothetical protein